MNAGRLCVERIPDSLLVSMGEDDAQDADIAAGRLPQGEYFVLRSMFEEAFTMRRWRPDQLGSFAWQLRFALAALRRVRALPSLKLVYITEEIPGLFVLLALRAARPGLKKVMLIHNVASKRRTLPFRLFGLAKDLDGVCCLSQTSKQYLIEQYGIPEGKITVLGSRVDEAFFSSQPMPEAGSPIVSSAGAINRDYGTLIEACQGLDVDLKIAADTAWKFSTDDASSERARAAAQASSRVEMRSWGSYLNLRDLYRLSTVVVVPLKDVAYASGQTVILEAMAMGRPVITSDIRGRSDFIEHGVTGIYVRPEDPAGLREAIRDLLEHPEKAAAIGQRAAAAVRERFSVRHYVDRILGACLAVL